MAHCPSCTRDLHRYPMLDAEPLVTFVNGVAHHSGHCESQALDKGKRVKITGFPMPADLNEKYGGGARR